MSNHVSFIARFFEERWYARAGVLLFLVPLEWLFVALAKVRKRRQQRNAYLSTIPTVVVGNVAVGGTGKTPLLIALVAELHSQGFRVAVVSRGYGSRAAKTQMPVQVNSGHSYHDVGDEPLEIFQATQCPVIVGGDRVQAIKYVERNIPCDVVLADDGLQNYRFGRHLEIVVIDGYRQWGNGHCLPVGPLREPVNRINSANFCIVTGGNESPLAAACIGQQFSAFVPTHRAVITPAFLVNIKSGERQPLSYLASLGSVVAVAGIGNPKKFFATLNKLGVTFSEKVFPDHHPFESNDFDDLNNKTIVMTAKDAVKCKAFATNNTWALHIALTLEPQFLSSFTVQLTQLREHS